MANANDDNSKGRYANLPNTDSTAGNRDEGMQDLNEQVDEASIKGDLLEPQDTQLRDAEPIEGDFIPDEEEVEALGEYAEIVDENEDEEKLYNPDDDSSPDYVKD